jgi:transmembrane 9 superfamily member 2/4
LLSILTSYGIQLFFVLVISFLFMRLEHLSPAFKKLQYMWILVVLGLTGWISGYLTSRLYKLYNGTSWLTASAAAGLSLPVYLLISFYVVEVIDWLERSNSDRPQFLLLESVLLSGNFNFLLVMVGCYIGFRTNTLSIPVKNSRFERKLP